MVRTAFRGCAPPRPLQGKRHSRLLRMVEAKNCMQYSYKTKVERNENCIQSTVMIIFLFLSIAILTTKKRNIISIKQKLKELNDRIIEVWTTFLIFNNMTMYLTCLIQQCFYSYLQLQREADHHQLKDMSANTTIMTTDGRLVLREREYTNLMKLKQVI